MIRRSLNGDATSAIFWRFSRDAEGRHAYAANRER